MDDILKSRAKMIDAYYDALLVDGMDLEVAQQIEDQRTRAHRKLASQVVNAALSDQQVTYVLGKEDDPIKRVG